MQMSIRDHSIIITPVMQSFPSICRVRSFRRRRYKFSNKYGISTNIAVFFNLPGTFPKPEGAVYRCIIYCDDQSLFLSQLVIYKYPGLL